MTDILKDVENVASAAIGLRTRLILAAGTLAILGVLAAGFAHHFEDRGRQLERAGWLKKEAVERAADAALVEQHHQEMNELEKHHLQLAMEVSHDHEKELAQLRQERDADRRRADAAGGLRIPAPACPAGRPVEVGPGAETASAGGRDEAGAGTIRLPRQIENDLWAIADDADEVSAQLRACQAWIVKNEFYSAKQDFDQSMLGKISSMQNNTPEDTDD